MTPPQVLDLLSQNSLGTDLLECVKQLQSQEQLSGWPEEGSELEALIFDAAAIIFSKLSVTLLQKELRRVLGETFYSHLILFLCYNQMCHKWAESHPELSFEADSRAMENLQPLLAEEPELATFFQTYQVRLKQRLVNRDAELLSKEFRLLFEKSPMPIVITDLESRIVRVNNAFIELTGYPQEELIQYYAEDLESPEFRQNSREAVKRLRDNVASAIVIEKAFQHKSGKKVWVTSTVSAIRAGDDPVYLIALVKDISLEREELENEKLRSQELEQRVLERTVALEIARDDAIRANILKTEFVSNISHEIRTPMSGILGLGEMLVLDTTGETKEAAEHILKSAQTLMSLVDNLLDISRLETGRFSISNEQFSLAELVSSVVNTFQFLAKQKGLSITTSLDPYVPMLLMGDQLRIGQILKNLLSNAIKFTDHGTISISTKLLKHSNSMVRVRFSVTDTGIGVSEEDQKRLFKLFVQVDGSNTRKYGGSGLGLSICDRLVTLMDGKIELQSTEGAGSTFSFELMFDL
jgi:PAS domain S-box-containing protein